MVIYWFAVSVSYVMVTIFAVTLLADMVDDWSCFECALVTGTVAPSDIADRFAVMR